MGSFLVGPTRILTSPETGFDGFSALDRCGIKWLPASGNGIAYVVRSVDGQSQESGTRSWEKTSCKCEDYAIAVMVDASHLNVSCKMHLKIRDSQKTRNLE